MYVHVRLGNMSCLICLVIAVLSLSSCPGCPGCTVSNFLCQSSCPCCHILAGLSSLASLKIPLQIILFWQSCLSRLFCPSCFVLSSCPPILCRLSFPSCSIFSSVPCRLFCFQLSCFSCSVSALLFHLSCPSCLVYMVSYPAVIFWTFCPICPILAAWSPPDPAVLGCLVLAKFRNEDI